MGKRLLSRAVTLLGAAAVASVAFVAVSAAPAHAADLGTVNLSQQSGLTTASPMFALATASAPCPATFGTEAALRIGRVGGPYANLAAIAGGGGHDTTAPAIAPNRSFQQAVGTAFGPGAWQIVIECFSLDAGRHPERFVTNITVTGDQWRVPVVEATTTALTSSAATIDLGDPVTLTATVAPTAAAGTVQFRRGSSNIPVGAPVTVSGGTASVTTTELVAGTYNLTAAFTATDPSAFGNSVSAPVAITVTGPEGDQELIELTADIAPGAFSLDVVANSAILAGGQVGGSATGALPQATVTDLRGTNAGWNVTGQVEDFTKTPAPGTVPGSNLGWVPSAAKTGGSGAVVAGLAVTPGTTVGGLADSATLCRAASGSSAGTFTCDAALTLNIPDSTLPGTYSATLTLTLI